MNNTQEAITNCLTNGIQHRHKIRFNGFYRVLAKIKSMIKYHCSDGTRVSQSTIDNRRNRAYDLSCPVLSVCACCGKAQWTDHDHTISQKRCKELHKTELIWDPNNWSYSCRDCHNAWESYKSGVFQHHYNVVRRMLFIKEHDPEGYQKRLAYITDEGVLNILETEF